MPLSRRRFAGIALAPLLAPGAAVRGQSPSKVRPAPRVRSLVPAYFYPGGPGLAEWDRLVASVGRGRADVAVIVNPASGPGERVDPSYTAALRRLVAAKLIPIGYVTTSYAKKPPEAAKAEVDRWLRLYPGVRGIFFDEQASAAEHVAYQKGLYDHVRGVRGLELVVTNPGTTCDEGYVARSAADVVCVYEGPRGGFVDRPAIPRWVAKYPPSRSCVLEYGVPTADAMRSFVAEAARSGVGCVYVTDAPGPMPWDRLPRYWADELKAD